MVRFCITTTLILISLLCLNFKGYAEELGIDVSDSYEHGQSQSSDANSSIAWTNRQCTPELVNENEEIIKTCNANWAKWGITPPPDSEMRKPNECSGLVSRGTLEGCVDAILALPIFIGELAAYAMVSTVPINKNTLAFVSQNGSLQEIQAYLGGMFLKETCGWAPWEADLIPEILCPQDRPETNSFMNPERRRACVADAVQKSLDYQQCRRSRETRQASRTAGPEIDARAQAIKQEQDEQKRLRTEQKNELERISSTCRSEMNGLTGTQNLILGMTTFGIGNLAQEAQRSIAPTRRQVSAYTKCIERETMQKPELRDKLIHAADGLMAQISRSFESIKCYNEKTRKALMCEVAIAVLSGGTALSASAIKRLGRKSLDELIPPPNAPPPASGSVAVSAVARGGTHMGADDVSYLSGLTRETSYGKMRIIGDDEVGAIARANKDDNVMAIVNGKEFNGTSSELLAHLRSQKNIDGFTLGGIRGAGNEILATRPGVSKIITSIDGTGRRGMEAIDSLSNDHVTEVTVMMKAGQAFSFKGNKEMLVEIAGRDDVATIVMKEPGSWLKSFAAASASELGAAPVYSKILNPALVSRSSDQGLSGITVRHGTIDGLVGSVKQGPRNVGSGFGGRGLYLDLEADGRIADEYATHAAKAARARSDSAGVALTTSKPVVMTGRLNPNKNLSVLSIRVSRDVTKPNFQTGVFPFDWDKDPALALYVEKNFDVVQVLDAAKNGFNLNSDRILIIHERAGADAIVWQTVDAAK